MSTLTISRPATNWKLILMISGGFLLIGLVFLRGFWFPFQENRKKLAELQDEYDAQRRSFMFFIKEKKRLERDRLLGLPRDLNEAQTQYVKYLQALLTDCGFDARPDITPTDPDLRGLSGGQGGKKAGHIPVAFIVKTQGNWGNILKFLDRFQRAPFLHRFKSWTVSPVAGTGKGPPEKLTMNVIIEALVVNRNEQRPESLWGIDTRLVAVDAFLGMNRLPAGWATLLRAQALLLPEAAKRNYAELNRLKPFVGGIPVSDRDLEKERADAQKKKDDEIQAALAKTSLVFTSISEKEALLVAPGVDSAAKPTEIKLAPAVTFLVKSGKKGKVLRIDHYYVYFEFDGDIYAIEIGQKMVDALKQPVSALERKNLNLQVN